MTIKSLFVLFLLGTTLKSFSQLKISNEKTESHILIGGTSTFIIPPAGFNKALNFTGFEDAGSGSSMIVNEVPAPFEQLTESFSKENLSRKGIEFLTVAEYTINNAPAVIINTRQFSATHGYYFFKSIMIASLGNSKTLLINANIPEMQKEKMYQLVTKSLLSILNDSSIVVSPFASLDFEVDLKKSSFKLNKSISGTLVLEGPKKELFMIAKSIRQLDPLDKKGAAIQALKAISTIEYVGLIDGKDITQDGMSGYQIAAKIITKENGMPMKAVQAVLFTHNSYYVFLTILNPDEQELVKDFNFILNSFKRK